MNGAFIGWQYIETLLNLFKIEVEKCKNNHIVTPRFIYRGITQRHFTSSEIIHNYLSDSNNRKELSKLIQCFYGKDFRRVSEGNISESITDKQWYKIEKYFYDAKKNKLNQNISNWNKKNNSSPEEVIEKVITDEDFKYVKPQYIRSGAAVRLYQQKNRTTNDYISYLKNLIIESKSRFPIEYAQYSDLEILADIQHNGGASCLVDFSANFLIALWFATQDYASNIPEIGYLFCYDVNTDAIEEDKLTILNRDRENKKIEDLIFDTTKSTKFSGKESFKFYLWKPSNINSRITRQDSIFIFGVEKFKIAEHPIIVLPIPYEWKRSIQYALKELFCINGESLYADSSGLSITNTKTNPLKTQTQYFSEDVLYISRSKREGKFNNFELFQKGTSSLLKAQYDIALNYFNSFEGTNYTIIKDYETNYKTGITSYNWQMLLIELAYSKGMCLRHLSKTAEAFTYYDKALSMNIKLLEILGFELLPYDEFKINESRNLEQDKLLIVKRYATNKFFKLLEDYISLLYDTRYFCIAYHKLIEVLNKFDKQASDEMRVLVETACNEIKILAGLYKNPKLDNSKIITTDNLYVDTFSSFCKVLNVYFRMIDDMINGNRDFEFYTKENDSQYINLVNTINSAIQNQEVSQNSSVFTAWILDDIKIAVENNFKHKPKIRQNILYLHSLVEDCQKQIEGRKRQEVY